MKTILSIIAILCALICACDVRKQSSNPPSAASPKPEENLPIPRGPFTHKATITTKYDRFKDKTSVTVGTTVYRNSPKLTLFLKADGEYMHQTPQPPETIKFGFYAIVHEWEFEGSRSFIVLADDQRLDFGEMERVSFLTEERVKVEDLSINMPFRKHLQIANAQSVEMQLRDVEFKLSTENLEALRDFASRFAK